MKRIRPVLSAMAPAAVKRLKRAILDRVYARRTARILREGIAADSGRQALRMAQRLRGSSDLAYVHAIQNAEEISALLDLLMRERVRTACEIGTWRGGTLFMLSRVLPDDAAIVAVDLPEMDPAIGERLRAMKPTFESFARRHQRLTVLHANSHEAATVSNVRDILQGQQLDFLFIDGDHSSAGVRRDFENFAPLVRTGGLIAFHDIVPNDAYADWGVPGFWKELTGVFETSEIVGMGVREARNGFGIGVLRWNPSLWTTA